MNLISTNNYSFSEVLLQKIFQIIVWHSVRQRLHEGEYPMNKYLNPINFWKKLVHYKDKVIYQPFYNLKKIFNYLKLVTR